MTCLNEFLWPVRVYYEDTDAGGVVYHARYLHFLERARTEWLRRLGFEQDSLAQNEGVLFAVRNLNIDYHKPARFNEQLVVHSSVKETGRVSFTFHQEIRRATHEGAASGELLTTAEVKVVCIDAAAFRPAAIPKSIKGALSGDN